MSSKRRKFGLASTLTALGVMLIAVAGAAAHPAADGNFAADLQTFATSGNTGDAYACQFDGTTPELVDPVPAPLDPPVPSLGGDGRYTFSGGATCVQLEAPDLNDLLVEQVSYVTEDLAGSGVYTGDISSKGHYVNIVCGTGTADGDNGANDTTLTVTGGQSIGSTVGPPLNTALDAGGPFNEIDYHIDFVGGQGVLNVTHVANGENPAEHGSGAGFVTLSFHVEPGAPPTTPDGNCVDQDVSRFSVNGAFTIVIPGSPG